MPTVWVEPLFGDAAFDGDRRASRDLGAVGGRACGRQARGRSWRRQRPDQAALVAPEQDVVHRLEAGAVDVNLAIFGTSDVRLMPVDRR